MSVSTLNTNASVSTKTLTVNENADSFSGVKTFDATPVMNDGIQFPAVQVPNAGANVLDDYEEGTWTPAIASAGGGAAGYTLQSGNYIKIGTLVLITGRIVLANVGTLVAGALSISGLPFASANIFAQGAIKMSGFTGFGTACIEVIGTVASNGTTVPLGKVTAAATGNPAASLLLADLGGTDDMTFSGFYFAAN